MDHIEFPFPGPYDTKNPQKRKTVVEFRIMLASQLIRARNGWREDLKNDKMVGNWKEEAIRNGLKPAEFTTVLDQLKYYDSLATESIEVGVVDGTRQADNLIPEQLKNDFVAAVNNFLGKSTEKDYEPETDNQIVNLLDPRLYCSVLGVTRITNFDLNIENCLQNIGNGKSEAVERGRCGRIILPVYQLLPAEFHVNKRGQVKIKSYINNLHPRFEASLYSLIERIFTSFVPLFNGVLENLLHEQRRAQKYFYFEPTTEVQKGNKKQKLEELGPTKTYLHGRDIQVIVKMKSIELTTDNPVFEGGDWHIEGNRNEHIVASGIYCYRSENITESRLHFRQLRGQNQEMGSIGTPEGRLLAFPNICEHRIGPFKLADESRPGFRNILVFFLIDPNTRITSTRNVPPQQMSWFEEELLTIQPFDRLNSCTVRSVTNLLDWPLSNRKAMSFRKKIIKSRKQPAEDIFFRGACSD